MKAIEKRAELLSRRITSCTSCDLHLYCNSPVPPLISSTTITPELLMIGEAPGSQEDREGEPFVGPAGNLIFRWLKIEMGLSRKQCMVGNSISCRPTVANKGKMNRAPSKGELWACRDNLARTVDYYTKAGGRWMLLAGATALQSFVPEARIGQWAGRPFVLTHRGGLLNVMATYHPAAALRDVRHSPTIRRHLNYLAALKHDPGLWWESCFCGAEVDHYDGMGVAWCGKHRGYGRAICRLPELRAVQSRLAV